MQAPAKEALADLAVGDRPLAISTFDQLGIPSNALLSALTEKPQYRIVVELSTANEQLRARQERTASQTL
ncbi:hypothetical protein X772_35505 [Mesorhizobium sp. LSJC280B00]|nr:hypothetical protein X772_35505 [Mesorhizobium sp. LSJC280B00]